MFNPWGEVWSYIIFKFNYDEGHNVTYINFFIYEGFKMWEIVQKQGGQMVLSLGRSEAVFLPRL